MTRTADWLKDLSTDLATGLANDDEASDTATSLQRIARALEILSGTASVTLPDWSDRAYVWDGRHKALRPVQGFSALTLSMLVGISQQREILETNTRNFASGLPANSALLWGARGTGKSSLVKSVFHETSAANLHLIEIHKEDLGDLGLLADVLAATPDRRFILFIDDLSFESSDDRYKSLKSALEGSITARSGNMIVYATSNRRHLMPRKFEENDQVHLHPSEMAEENISLSDRFGLWLGFYPCDQAQYLEMVMTYAENFNLLEKRDIIERLALEWATTRGSRSGRVAWQFIQHLASQSNRQIDS